MSVSVTPNPATWRSRNVAVHDVSYLAYTGESAPSKGHGKVRPGTSVILTIRAAR